MIQLQRLSNRELRKRKRAGVTYSRHHRRCRSNGGSDEDSNISIVTRHQHVAWHDLFSNYTPETICAVINEKWLDPAYKFVVEHNE